ncbi:unnamed protein product [Acanthoscelides obtectus]|uniref:Uncharacterized protein n=1 Tax=Acanthoscelides obtectus TaxID=200917 RepID=A0A9P0JZK2_ACAOB|nr:unnamed protein product [Acanthoscelides obtectus]CAK1663488.1 hypothetical protein AOBTE_LOCUS23702 [Acanthoscelides obtectus]
MFHASICFLLTLSCCALAKPLLSIEDYGDKLKGMVHMLHDTCVARSGVDDSKIEEMKTGKFGSDPKAKKYVHCIWSSTVVNQTWKTDCMK